MKSKYLFVMLGTLVMMFMAITPVDALRSYNIILKSGSHGTIFSQDELVQTYDYGDPLNQTLLNALVVPEEGYYFTGYSPKIPDEVNREETFVAQYRLIIDQVTYQVNYLDEKGNQLATSLVKATEKGVMVSVIAEEIENYAVDAPAKSATIDQDGVQITFIYTAIGGVNDDSGNVAGDGTVVVINPGTGTGITIAGPNQGDLDNTEGSSSEDDKATSGEAEVDINENEVPTTIGSWDTNTIVVVGVAMLLLPAVLIRFLFFNKKRSDRE